MLGAARRRLLSFVLGLDQLVGVLDVPRPEELLSKGLPYFLTRGGCFLRPMGAHLWAERPLLIAGLTVRTVVDGPGRLRDGLTADMAD